MLKGLFITDTKCTQEFGENPANYARFGLKGHEGVDLVPDGITWGVHALERGVVVLDDDDGDERGSAYGVSVRVQNDRGRVLLYAHMSENCVELKQVVEKGQLIGIMGNTGNSHGAHVHLSVYMVSASGERLAYDNGYKGMRDPSKEIFD